MRRNNTPFIWFLGAILVMLGIALSVKQLVIAQTVVSDFTQDYVAALALQKNISIYDTFTKADIQTYMPEVAHLQMNTTPVIHTSNEHLSTSAQFTETPIINFHPPFNVLLFTPLSLLPYNTAIIFWSLFTILLYVGIGYMILHEIEIVLPKAFILIVLGLALCWYQFQVHLLLGQLSILLTACVVGSWFLLQRGHKNAAGVLLGVATLIKLFPGLLFIYLLMRRQWRSLIVAWSTFAIGAVVTLFVVGKENILRYAFDMMPLNITMHANNPGNISLSGVWYRLFVGHYALNSIMESPDLANVLAKLSSIVVCGILVFHVWNKPITKHNDITAYALFCVAMLLLSPITWGHALPLLFLPMGLLCDDVCRKKQWHMRLPLLFVFVVLCIPDITFVRWLRIFYYPSPIPWTVGLVLLTQTIALIVVWVLLVKRFKPAQVIAHADTHVSYATPHTAQK